MRCRLRAPAVVRAGVTVRVGDKVRVRFVDRFRIRVNGSFGFRDKVGVWVRDECVVGGRVREGLVFREG